MSFIFYGRDLPFASSMEPIFQRKMGWFSLFFIVWSLTVWTTTSQSVYSLDCNEDLGAVDRAKVTLEISTLENLALYVINDECYKCAKLLAGTIPSTGMAATCVAFYTPFPWSLYLTSADDSNDVLDEIKYTFGDSGYYSLSADANGKLVVTETKAPDDPMRPLFILIGVLVAVTVLFFLVPALYNRYWEGPSKNKEPVSEYQPVRTSQLDPEEVTLQKIEGEEVKLDQHLTTSLMHDGKNVLSIKPSLPLSSVPGKGAGKKQKFPRLKSLDTFRGISLTLMIFVNYGGGGYWFFDHAAWNGLTFADLLFPWFMWIMGVSMAISFHNILPAEPESTAYVHEYRSVWLKAIQRAVTLFCLGMFLANGYEYTTWRVPGVLQYFAAAYGITAATILLFYQRTRRCLEEEEREYEDYLEKKRYLQQHGDQFLDQKMGIGSDNSQSCCSAGHSGWIQWFLDTLRPAKILWAYRYEWLVQLVLLLFYLIMHFGVAAPGCPAGYAGAGGLSENGDYQFCTGGIHRYIDMKLFGYWFIFHHPTCLELYECQVYDPEGFLGAWSACTLAYLGLMAGRILIHSKEHSSRLLYWGCSAIVWLFLAGCLCGFSQNDGVMPINKNMWTTSFILVCAGMGLVGLSFCYSVIDIYQQRLWTGAPFVYMGMNSIMIYCGHGILAGYMPFSYMLYHINHGALLCMNVMGTFAWVLIAFYCYKIKFFVKV